VPGKLLTVCGLVLVLALVAAGAALAGNGGLGPADPASPNASRISGAYWLVAIFAGLVFVLVEGALIMFIVRFRRGGRPRDAEGPQIHGSTKLELIWTVVPVLILAFIGGFVFYKLPGIRNVPAASAGNRLNVQVEGRQFYWEFRYPNGVVSVDRLRLPLDEVVTLDVSAPAYDVIHSWWIPRLGGKIDAIPGKVNHTWLRATKTGEFRGQCAELCGLQHAAMHAVVEVMSRQEFDGWLAQAAREQRAGTPELGKETFVGVCQKCHRLSGERLYGPNLLGNPLLSDKNGLTLLLRNGRGKMPAVGRGWPDEQIDSLLAFTRSSKNLEALSGG
jgi:cytochrome c oxidase subunit II